MSSTTSSTAATSPTTTIDPTTLLSHLASRPSVLSTLILSRKDGSIIGCTGHLATSTTTTTSSSLSSSSNNTNNGNNIRRTTTTTSEGPGPTENGIEVDREEEEKNKNKNKNKKNKEAAPPAPAPTPAETLARRVFEYVSCASALASDVHSIEEDAVAEDPLDDSGRLLTRRFAETTRLGEGGPAAETGGEGGSADGGGGKRGEEGQEQEQEQGVVVDEEKVVKLLRLRTKGFEVVVSVEREWLMVVVNGSGGEKGRGGG